MKQYQTAIVLTTIGLSALIFYCIRVSIVEKQQQNAAQNLYPQICQYIEAISEYKDIKVELSPPNEGYIFISGNLPTQVQCDTLENELRKRFNCAGFELRYVVLSRYEDERK